MDDEKYGRERERESQQNRAFLFLFLFNVCWLCCFTDSFFLFAEKEGQQGEVRREKERATEMEWVWD